MDFNAAGMLAVVVIFLIAHWFLKVTFFRPLVRILERREERVESAQQIYDRANAEAEKALAEEKEKLNSARKRAAEHREALRKEAQDQRALVLAEVKQEVQEQLAAVREELSEQVRHERVELEARARELADDMTERLLGRAV